MPIGNGGVIGPANLPSPAGARGVWSLREVQASKAAGQWPLSPNYGWLAIGPDSALPVQQSEWVLGRGWYGGHAYPSVAAYLAAAGGDFARGSDRALITTRTRIWRSAFASRGQGQIFSRSRRIFRRGRWEAATPS